MNVAAAVCASTLSCAVSLSVNVFPAHPAERFVLNGKVMVMLTTVCSIQSVLSRDSPRERTYLGDIIRTVLSWDPCLRQFNVGCPDGNWSCPGEWPVTGT